MSFLGPICDIPHYLKVFQAHLSKRMYLIFILPLMPSLKEGSSDSAIALFINRTGLIVISGTHLNVAISTAENAFRALAEEGQSQARQKYLWANVAEKYGELFDQVVSVANGR
jgi:hypothetical protein